MNKHLGTIRLSCAGHFTIFKHKEGEEPRMVADFDNLIVNQGMDRIGVGSCFQYIHVGTGSAAEANTDTQLQTFKVATSANGGFGDTTASLLTGPYWVSRTITRQFTPGQATGNITEVGAAWSATPTNLFSRALIRDGGGTPIAITVLANEYLTIQYTLKTYVSSTDVVSVINVDGVDRTVTLRVEGFPNQNWQYIGATSVGVAGSFSGYQPSVSNGTIGPFPSGGITGSQSVNPVQTWATYTNGNYYRDTTLTCSPSQANFTPGIGAVRIVSNGGDFQVGIVPVIVKTSADVFTLSARIAWARH